MSETTNDLSRAERVDHATTVISGWAAVVLGVLGLHIWVAVGFNWWARAGMILSFGLAIMWIWGFWPQITQRTRAWFRSGGLNTTLVALGLVVALILVNTMVRRRIQVKADLTKNQRFTLAPRTREILKSLKSPVTATVFLPAGRGAAQGRDTFKQFAEASANFNWTQVDPLVNPQKYLTMSPQPKLDPTTLSGAVLEYNGKRQDVTEFTEKEITSALLKMTRDSVRKIAFLKGHGESTPDEAAGAGPAKSIQVLTQDLKDSQWVLESVDLYSKDAKAPSPAEVAVLVIAGPEKPLSADEQKRVDEYLNNGGRVLLLLNPLGPTFSDFTKRWGLNTRTDLVVDRTQGLILTGATPSSHVAVRPARRVVFRYARSVTPVSPAPTGVTVTELLKTGPTAEVIANFDPKTTDPNTAPAEGQPREITLIALAEKALGSGADAKKAKLLVVGDNDFMTDQLAQAPSIFNRDLASGLINYLGEEEALVEIAPKDENTEQAFLTPDQGRLLPLIHLLDFPLLALLLAIIVYVKRR
ncbi:MAG: GldG family protein [Actinomycetota bacterium]